MREGEDEAERHGVPACSDAERRQATELARALSRSGRDVKTVTLWVRPAWRLVQAICAAAAVAASVIAVDDPVLGLVIAVCALLLAAADLSRFPLLRRLTPARATQNVIAPPPSRGAARPVTLVLTASLDDPPRAMWPAPAVRPTAVAPTVILVLVALLVVRAAGADGLLLDVAQLLPTLALLALIALLADSGRTAPIAAGGQSASQIVLEVAARLDALPPRNLDVAVVLAGAGGAHAAGLGAWLRGRRSRGLDPASLAILQLEPPDDAGPRWWERDGLVRGRAMHPQLIAAARRSAAAAGAQPGPRHAVTTPAAIARAGGWPAIAISGDVTFAQALVTELDASLDEPSNP